MASWILKKSASFTRPNDTTAYADTDLVANSTAAGSVSPLTFGVNANGFRIVGARINKSDETDVALATFTLHLFESSPTVANGDNGALSHNLSGYLGSIAFPIMTATTDEGKTQVNLGSTALPGGIYGSSQVIYGLLEAKAAYVPAALEVFTVTLWVEKNI
jgi:hypothetical protein